MVSAIVFALIPVAGSGLCNSTTCIYTCYSMLKTFDHLACSFCVWVHILFYMCVCVYAQVCVCVYAHVCVCRCFVCASSVALLRNDLQLHEHGEATRAPQQLPDCLVSSARRALCRCSLDKGLVVISPPTLPHHPLLILLLVDTVPSSYKQQQNTHNNNKERTCVLQACMCWRTRVHSSEKADVLAK